MRPVLLSLLLPEKTSNFCRDEVDTISMAKVIDLQLLSHWEFSHNNTLVLLQVLHFELTIEYMYRYILVEFC